MTKNFGDPPCPLGGRFFSFFLGFFRCAHESLTRTCAWGFHAHRTITTELIKYRTLNCPPPPDLRPKKAEVERRKAEFWGKPTRG